MEDEIIEVIEQPQPSEVETSVIAEEPADPAPATEDPAGEPAKKENKVQERIDKITREKHEARQEAERERQEKEYWRKVATGEIKPQPTQPEPAEQMDFIPPGYRPEPQLDQFEDWDQYNRAILRWEAGRIIAERDYVAEQRKANEEKRSVANAHIQRVEKAKDKYADYDDVIGASTTPYLRTTLDAIAESEQSADIAYFLASNQKEAERIIGLNPVQQIKEIAKLEVKFSSTPAPQPKRVTQAPAPISAIGGTDSGIVDESKMTDEQWIAHERKRLAAQGRRY